MGYVVPCGLAVALLVAGCSTEPDARELTAFCDRAASLADGSVLAGVDLTALAAPSAGDASLRTARDAVIALSEAPAPAEVAEAWGVAVEPLVGLLDALADEDAQADDPSSSQRADRLRLLTDALAAPEVVEATEAVDAFVAEHC